MLRIILKEGKAIQATEDMRLFADEVVEELQPFIQMPLLIWSETEVFYWREVEGPHGKSKRIGVRFKKVKTEWPDKSKLGFSNVKAGGIIILAYKLDKNGDPIFYPPSSGEIVHELIHCFDPKLEYGKEIAYKGMKDRNEQTYEEYVKDQVEQDAYMRQDAISMASSLDRFPIEKVKELLLKKLVLPEVADNLRQGRMKIWKTDPKMWRKFLNTVYDEVVSRRLPKSKPSKFQQAKQDKEGLTP